MLLALAERNPATVNKNSMTLAQFMERAKNRLYKPQVRANSLVKSAILGHNIFNPTTSRDSPQEQVALVRNTTVTTPNAPRNRQPDNASGV